MCRLILSAIGGAIFALCVVAWFEQRQAPEEMEVPLDLSAPGVIEYAKASSIDKVGIHVIKYRHGEYLLVTYGLAATMVRVEQ